MSEDFRFLSEVSAFLSKDLQSLSEPTFTMAERLIKVVRTLPYFVRTPLNYIVILSEEQRNVSEPYFIHKDLAISHKKQQKSDPLK